MKDFLLPCVLLAVLAACSQAGDNEKKSGKPASSSEMRKGEELFKANCAQCHQPGKNFVGPSLAGVEARWKNKATLYDFVRNSTEVIQRDKYAADLYEKWNESPMLPFPQLSDADIAAILQYCDAAAARGNNKSKCPGSKVKSQKAKGKSQKPFVQKQIGLCQLK